MTWLVVCQTEKPQTELRINLGRLQTIMAGFTLPSGHQVS